MIGNVNYDVDDQQEVSITSLNNDVNNLFNNAEEDSDSFDAYFGEKENEESQDAIMDYNNDDRPNEDDEKNLPLVSERGEIGESRAKTTSQSK